MDNQTGVAVAITAIVGPLITVLVQRGIEWVNNRQKNRRESRADVLIEYDGIIARLKSDREDVYRQLGEFRSELRECHDSHQEVMRLNALLTARVTYLEDSLTERGAKFRPFDPAGPGSSTHLPGPEKEKPK